MHRLCLPGACSLTTAIIALKLSVGIMLIENLNSFFMLRIDQCLGESWKRYLTPVLKHLPGGNSRCGWNSFGKGARQLRCS